MMPKLFTGFMLFLGYQIQAPGAVQAPAPAPTHEVPVRASFYASKFEGRLMANGHRYKGAASSAASLRYPVGSVIEVKSIRTGKVIQVTITDRGPWSTKFSLDLSGEAFRQLGLSPRAGWGWVTTRRIG